jgi:DNA-binding transcriptional LysR family regulator
MHKDINWDDLRFVLAVAETGALSRAAAVLGVNHATVLRRVGAFEDRIGMQVFDRTPKGYLLSEAGQKLLPAITDVENAVATLDRLASGADAAMRGNVRLASTDTLTTTVLPRIGMSFTQAHPGITIELLTSSLQVSLSRLDADFVVRPTLALPKDMVGEVAAVMGFAVYGRRDVVDRARRAPEAAPWLDVNPALRASPPGKWLAENVPRDRVVASADSFVALRALAGAGGGLGLLPCILGDEADNIVRLARGTLPLKVPVWVAVHGDMVNVPRLATAQRHFTEGLAAAAPRILGEA